MDHIEQNIGPYDSPFNLILFQNLIFFHQNIDVNIKFRYSLIIINHQIYEKTLHFDIKSDSSKLQ
jgi:hypothetical protein